MLILLTFMQFRVIYRPNGNYRHIAALYYLTTNATLLTPTLTLTVNPNL